MSVVHYFTGTKNNFTWQGIEIHKYGDKELEGVTRQVIIGPQDQSSNFAVRYFRLEPGTSSNLERHSHEHGVVVMHGHARLQLNDDLIDLKTYDSIFISGDDLHQFTAMGNEPFGFLCVVPAK